jgi:hypothetical protein
MSGAWAGFHSPRAPVATIIANKKASADVAAFMA